MPESEFPGSGRSDGKPSRPGPWSPSAPTPQPQYQTSGASGPQYGGQAGSQPWSSGPNAPYSGQPYGSPFPTEEPAKNRNAVGIVGLVVAVLGTIMSVVPGAAIIGWILLPFGFILGLVGLFMSGKPKGTSIAAVIVSIVGTIVAMAFFVTVIGDAFEEAFDDEVTVSQPESGSSGAGAAPDSIGSDTDDSTGSRANPSAIGDVLSSDEWEVVVNSFTRNATDQVMAANMFNDPPPPGSQYALVNLTATYIGDESGHADFLRAAFVTDTGNVIRDYDHSAVTPDPLEGELYTGASATGNIALAVPEGEPGLLRLALGAFGGEVFVAVE